MNSVDFTIYDEVSGQILRYGSCPQDQVDSQVSAGEGLLLAVGSFGKYVENEFLTDIPARPSDSHDWDWPTKTWQPNLSDAIVKKKAAVESERSRRSVAPITFSGSQFDADATARERITGTLARLLRGDGLPVGWVGWRDYDNAMHWGSDAPAQVQTQLAGLSAEIEDREQAMLIAAWTHKATLDAIDDIDDALAYDVTAGWPA